MKRARPELYDTETDSSDDLSGGENRMQNRQSPETSDSETDSSDDLSGGENWMQNRQSRKPSGKSRAGPLYTHFPRSCEWERTPAMREMKSRHQDRLDAEWDGDRERHIYETVLKERDVHLEPNRFPYACDAGIFHYTLWSRRDLSHEEILSFVDSWCRDAAPWVSEWAYEENTHLSFDIPHVHVFLRCVGSFPAVDLSEGETRPSTPPTRKRRKRWDVPPSPLSELKCNVQS